MTSPSPGTLDKILAWQLTLAWAGEGRRQPERLGWWSTDLCDPLGGGDLLLRLVPRTAAWASLEAAREAARRTEAESRKSAMAHPDQVCSLFALGVPLDQLLADRLAEHKRALTPPAQALPLPLDLQAPFNKDALAAALRTAPEVPYQLVPEGRQLKGAPPKDPELLVRALVAALLPLSDRYPMPFYRHA